MKKLLVFAVLAAILAAGAYAYAQPYMAVDRFRTALLERDSEELNEVVDFPALRENVKGQLNAAMAESGKEELGGNPFAALGMALAGSFVDRFVDSLVTPQGLARLAAPKDSSASGTSAPLDNAEMGYDGASRFVVSLKGEGGESAKLIFRRRVFDWQLTNVVMSPSMMELGGCSKNQSAAKTNLKAAFIAFESYRAEYDRYPKTLEEAAWQPRGGGQHYRYEVVQSTATTNLIRASGIGEMAGDVWEIDQNNELVNVANKCGG